jgi:hypothetical protein
MFLYAYKNYQQLESLLANNTMFFTEPDHSQRKKRKKKKHFFPQFCGIISGRFLQRMGKSIFVCNVTPD